LASLANLKVDLAVQTSVKLDDFATDLAFAQKSVPAITDKTSLFLIGAVAGPIAQNLVDAAVLAFTEANITNITNEGFDLSLAGSLTNVGPLDALITFVEPVTVTFQGKNIAQITLPSICAAANVGVPNYAANAHLTITDTNSFTEFATFLLHNPSFTWTISTPNLRLTALGTIFDGVSLSKDVSFKAFNGLPGVTISNFQLPSDDPSGGIHIETDASIPSPSQLGINLGTVTFQSFFQNTLVGPLSANNLVLTPNAVSKTHLSGRIVSQTGANLDVLGELFSGFLAGQNLTLVTKGDSVQPPGSSQPVGWLNTAFQSLSLEVILPGEKLQIIKQIDLNDLAVTIQTQDQAFKPPASSQHTVAKYSNPFGFSLQVVQSGETIDLASHGTDVAQLVLPKVPADGGVSTGNLANLDISFQNIPLTSLNDAAFGQLFAGVTLSADLGIELKGTASVVARTSIGDVPISGIPFDVTSDLKGINAFGGTAALSNVSVVGSGGVGGSEFVVAPLQTTLQNPSNVSLNTVSISLPVIFNGVNIGRTAINEFDLKPGQNIINAEFHYKPADANDTVAQVC
jgi:antitoxin (DNA-binding transcriptional repressor) of toxin-antitoxin stability system